METSSEFKALHIVANSGYTDEIMGIIRAAGGKGGTIIHARGEGSHHRSIMGITVDLEQEIIISIADKDTAEKIMDDIKEKVGWKTDARGLCYMMPIDRIIGLHLDQNDTAEVV